MLPFLAVPLSATYRRAPLTTLTLAVLSAAWMITATITLPNLSALWSTNTWWHRLSVGWFNTHHISLVLAGVFLAIAIALAARVTPRPRIIRMDLELAALALASWVAIYRAIPPLIAHYSAVGEIAGLIALLALGVALAAVVTFVAKGKQLALVAALPLIAVVVRRLDHTTLVFILVAISVALLLTFSRPRRVAL
jgi:hypothetical protein